jgi:hypothetical protein
MLFIEVHLVGWAEQSLIDDGSQGDRWLDVYQAGPSKAQVNKGSNARHMVAMRTAVAPARQRRTKATMPADGGYAHSCVVTE